MVSRGTSNGAGGGGAGSPRRGGSGRDGAERSAGASLPSPAKVVGETVGRTAAVSVDGRGHLAEAAAGAPAVDEVSTDDDDDGTAHPRGPARGPNLVRMSEFARESGVPIPTIKHYLREGLLPEPVRTSRNMAYYDRALIPRVRAIKDLQRTQFLPLKIIREILDGLGAETPAEDAAVQASIQRVLAADSPDDSRTRAHLIEAGLPPEELDLMMSLGIVSPRIDNAGEAHFHGDDLALLRTLGHARRAGLSAEMLPANVLATYLEHLHGLVRAELHIFRAGVLPRAGDRLEALSEAATTLSERLVVLLRRKLLVPVLEEIVREERARVARG